MMFTYQGPSSAEVNHVLNSLVRIFINNLDINLKGLYLHGSLAMGCFRPWTSDIDLLAVVHSPMDRQNKLDIVHDIMEVAESGSEFVKVEFSVVTAEDAARAKHPIPYILHYSNTWHEAYKRGEAELVINGGTDEDLAAHFTVIRRRGVRLAGAPIKEAIGEVPREDYLKAVWYDIKNAESDIDKNPAYVILNQCRTLMYLETGRVGSKLEGGQWALEQPQLAGYAQLVHQMIGAYMLGQATSCDPEALRDFVSDLLGRIRELLPFPV